MQEKPEKDQNAADPPDIQNNIQTIISQHLPNYLQATKHIQPQQHQYLNIINTLSQNQQSTVELKQSDMVWTWMGTQNKQQAKLKLKVEVGGVVLPLSLVFLDQNSPLSNTQTAEQGAYGKVYTLQLLGKDLAIKTYPFAPRGPKQEWIWMKQLQLSVKQYIITFISGRIECGPLTSNALGYDLLVFNDRIQFFMEKCYPIERYTPKNYHDLLLSMVQLHRRNIVHSDINTSNIMYSPTFGKLVFIDYGFSDFLVESLGQKTYTGFQGTASFVSSEMLKLFSVQNKKDFIDLYFNDLVALQNTHRCLTQYFSLSKKKGPQSVMSGSVLLGLQNVSREEEEKYQNQTFYHFIALQNWITQSKPVPPLFEQYKFRVYKKYHQQILEILPQINSQQILKAYLFQELKQFSYTDSFKDLCRILSIRQNNIVRANSYVSVSILPYKWFHPESEEYECLFKHCFSFSKEQINKSILKCLLSKQFYALQNGTTMYYTLLMEIIRFDCRDNQRSVKQEVALHFIELVNLKVALVNDSFTPIRATIKYVFGALLKSQQKNIPFKTLIFHTVVQAILTSTDICDELEELKKFIFGYKRQIGQNIDILGDFFHALRLFQLKYVYFNPEVKQLMKVKLTQCVGGFSQFIIQQHTSDKREQSQLIVSILKQLQLDSQQEEALTILNQKINGVEDIDTRAVLLKMLFYSVIKFMRSSYSSHNKSKWINHIRHSFSNIQYMKYRNFPEQIFWKYTLAVEAEKSGEVSMILSKIFYRISDKKVTSEFIFFIRRFSHLYFQSPVYQEMVGNFLRVCIQENGMRKYQRQLLNVMDRISSDPYFSNKKVHYFKAIADHWVPTLKQQIESIIASKISDDHEPFRMDESLIQCIHLFYSRFLQLHTQHRIFSSHLKEVEQIMLRLQWSLLELRPSVQFLSQYQSYLMEQFFKFIIKVKSRYSCYEQTLKSFKFQLSLLPKMPIFKKKQLMFATVEAYKELQEDPQCPQYLQILQRNPFIQKTVNWIWNYCLYNSFECLFDYSINLRVLTIKIMLVYLIKHAKETQTFRILLVQVAKCLGHISSFENIRYFELNIAQFCAQDYPLKLLEFPLLRRLKWQERFFLFYYSLALNYQDGHNIQQQLKYLKVISQNIYLHHWSSRQLILYIYYKNILKIECLNMKNPRKRIRLIRHQMLVLDPHFKAYFGYKKDQNWKQLSKLCHLRKKNLNTYLQLLKKKLRKMVV